jgi:hypothetical protein
LVEQSQQVASLGIQLAEAKGLPQDAETTRELHTLLEALRRLLSDLSHQLAAVEKARREHMQHHVKIEERAVGDAGDRPD